MLVGIAAAAFMLLSARTSSASAQKEQATSLLEADPVRVIQSIVPGISVLGAGTILHDGGKVEGLTAAASVLLAAAIGIAVANDQPLSAAMLAVPVATILFFLGLLARRRDASRPPRRGDQR